VRSVKVERKSRNNPRTKTVRPTTANKLPRGQREVAGVQPGTARRGRGGEAPSLARRLFFRPIVLLGAAGTLLVVMAALLVTGTVGRTVHGVNRAAGTVMGQAGFAIHAIHIAGERRTPEATIAAALDLHQDQSIFTADLSAARARLLALDWIASAEVVRRYPDSIYVTLVEKRPFALWQAPPDANGQARVAVVERSGGVITSQGVESFSRLPKLIGAGAPQPAAELIDAVSAHRAISARIAAYERVSQRRWNLILNNGVVVQLPETGWQKELDALERLIIDKGVLERDISEIDLRSPTQYFFILKNGDKTGVERGKET
jgi:cell division protein FtsQ